MKYPEFDSPKNWSEDFEHENGQYLCHCIKCKEYFFGHKRRVICKECDNKAMKTRREQVMELIKDFEQHRIYTKEAFADAIMAIPIEVPTVGEIMGKSMTYSAFPSLPDGEPDFEPSRAEDFDNGAHWMRDEILRRNKK